MQNIRRHTAALFATLCLLLLCGVQHANAQQHITFQGISFDNSLQAFGKALAAQGYEKDEEHNDFFYGQFMGEDATLLLSQTPKTHRVNSLFICSEEQYTDVKECAKVAGLICGQIENIYDCSIEVDEENTNNILHSYGFLSDADGNDIGYIAVNVYLDKETNQYEWQVYFSDLANDTLYQEEGGE